MMRPARTALITGASQGLGAALALEQAGPGLRLVLVARNDARLTQVAEACRRKGAEVATALIDVRDTARLAAFVVETDARWPIDRVFANAGIEASLGPGGTAEPLTSVLDQFHTNIDGVAATVTPLLDRMRARGHGTIVLVSSLAALAPLPDQPAYCASKAAVLAWGEALAPWLAAAGVRMVVACPGFVATGMSAHYQGWRPLEWSAERAARHILRAAEAGRSRVAFPWALTLLVQCGRLVPRGLRNAVIARLFRFAVAPSPVSPP